MTPSSSSTEDLKRQLKEMVKRFVYRRSSAPIRLTSGEETFEYFDGKQVTCFPERMAVFARLILASVDLGEIDAVGGMSTGADPIASSVSLLSYLENQKPLPVFYVRSEAKKHGLQKQIEGVELKKGMRVLIVEDVVTKGNSTLKAIETVEKSQAVVKMVVCLVDREAGGGDALRAKYPFVAFFTKSNLLK